MRVRLEMIMKECIQKYGTFLNEKKSHLLYKKAFSDGTQD
jgi:hypothetical protein